MIEITIPAGTSMIPAVGPAPSMYVADASTATVVDVDVRLGVYTVEFEDGEEYLVERSALMASGEIYENPGNNVTSRNGVSCAGSVRCGGGC